VQIDVMAVRMDTVNQLYKIYTSQELQAGSNYTVFLAFDGPLKDDLKGVYWGTYEENNETK
jgi:exo-beta-1,3-glucanase (GH17 family)